MSGLATQIQINYVNCRMPRTSLPVPRATMCRSVTEQTAPNIDHICLNTITLCEHRFNEHRRWPVHVQCRIKNFTFAISSPDECVSGFTNGGQ